MPLWTPGCIQAAVIRLAKAAGHDEADPVCGRGNIPRPRMIFVAMESLLPEKWRKAVRAKQGAEREAWIKAMLAIRALRERVEKSRRMSRLLESYRPAFSECQRHLDSEAAKEAEKAQAAPKEESQRQERSAKKAAGGKTSPEADLDNEGLPNI
jgi:hypothetical protein